MIRLRTSVPGLELRELDPADAGAYYELIDANRAHLSRHGDYMTERDATKDWVDGYFASPPDQNVRFGIWHVETLIGRVDLIPVQPPRYSIGYWLGGSHTGRGFATAACVAAIAYARDVLGATDVYAGITHGNTASVAVVRRLGFVQDTVFGTYSRFHLPLRPASLEGQFAAGQAEHARGSDAEGSAARYGAHRHPVGDVGSGFAG